MQNSNLWIVPNWPAPKTVRALTTLRSGGASIEPYASFNLAHHVNDSLEAVLKNRDLLKKQANLPSDPVWLTQVHGTRVIQVEDFQSGNSYPEADAAISKTPGQIAAVLTADCLPILLCNNAGTEVAAIHAGWRGLANGVIEATVAALNSNPKHLLAWFGPAIGPNAFEVGEEMRAAFNKQKEAQAFTSIPKDLTNNANNANNANDANNGTNATGQPQKWKADIYKLARVRLEALNITQIYGGDYCTYSEPERFYSFRRSNPTGRMASIIWIT